jgi:DNA polymerase-1
MQLTKGIYGGSAYSYANDADFRSVSTSEQFWQEVIDKYYAKYKGIAKWHKELAHEAQSTGRIVIPSGRYFPIVPDFTKRNPWPLTIIKNYPVQGFGADCVMLARLNCRKLLHASSLKAKLIGTIHDSIVIDCPNNEVERVAEILKQSIEDVPRMIKQIWDYDFILPLTCEIKYGPNKSKMLDI